MTLRSWFIIWTLFDVAMLQFSGTTAMAQGSDWLKMTPEQRNAYMQKLRSASGADWQRMLKLMNIELPTLPAPEDDTRRLPTLTRKKDSPNWYDAAEHIHVRSQWGSWSNYDETKANRYTLPDPLVFKNGKPVTNAANWWKVRRPEILKDYEDEIYGAIPPNTPGVQFVVDSVIKGAKYTTRYITGKPFIDLTLYMPVGIGKPIPLMVIVWGYFPPPLATIELLTGNGWAVATFNTAAVQADNGAGLTEGVIGYINKGQPRGVNDWGVLSAWSWGLSRAMDYFSTLKEIDPQRIGIQGHSRWGKTALWAAALDTRWAIVFSSCSGALGASLEKRNYGETIDNVAGPQEYHWMTGKFLKYAGHWDQMPVDAHLLMALIAPRPLFVTGGTRDAWADPVGEFLACQAASPVYELLGKKGVGANTMPAPDLSLIDGALGFRMHEGGHTDGPDWPVFLQFAQRCGFKN